MWINEVNGRLKIFRNQINGKYNDTSTADENNQANYKCKGPPLLSSGQKSGYRPRGPGFEFRRYQII
jgi:hypothetical protein